MKKGKNKYYDILYEEGFRDEPEEDIPEENIVPYDPEESKDAPKELVRKLLLLMVGLFLLEALFTALVLFSGPLRWPRGKWTALAGLLAGTLYGVFWLYNIKWQTESLLMPEATHLKGKLKLGASLRILLILVPVVVGWYFDIMHPVAIVIGALNLKIAALLSPVYDRIIRKYKAKTQ